MGEVLELKSELENALSWLESASDRLAGWCEERSADGLVIPTGDDLADAGYNRVMLSMTAIKDVLAFYSVSIKEAEKENDRLADLADAQSY